MAAVALTTRQKAAVIVRLLLEENGDLRLSALDRDTQALLAQEMAGMELIDRVTRDAVVTEFCDLLDAVGLVFPGNLDGTLDILGAYLSDDTNDRLRRLAALAGKGDPWERIAALPIDKIVALAQQESTDVVALLLAKLPVSKASETFTALGAARGRQVALAMSMAGNVSETTLRRVGTVLLQAADALPRSALDSPVVDRVGAILNFTTAEIRDNVLDGLDADDLDFAGGVRKAIFTFAHIPGRIDPRDVPKVVRAVETTVLIRALVAPGEADAAAGEFLLANLPQRVAESLRDDMRDQGKLRPREIEEGMTAVVAAIRDLQASGEIQFVRPDEDAEAA
ncbi:flagellar motor switch protein FliG [Paracoccus sp. TK19116]|uniref:Flagellar motor switch protein FliG n=1 Tax=Paracoccus albicereus TaxID=2922394 RepID=A0ABT1MTN7_9RHOB|nr:FliG C-terminal domain-containing protein [Paracoccus albicereus]MCQ0971685.1 flagellar motor switch protein FliG [Paracoccus albicereus]